MGDKTILYISEDSLKEISHLKHLGVNGRTVNCMLGLHNDGCGLDSSRSGNGPVTTLVSRNGLLGYI